MSTPHPTGPMNVALADRPAVASAGKSVFVVALAVLVATIGVLTSMTGLIPLPLLVAGAVISGLAGVVSTIVGLRPGGRSPALPTWPDPNGPPARASLRVSTGWLGMTLVFAVLTLVFPPSAFMMILTGALALRRYRLAFGALVAMVLVAITAALALCAMVLLG